MAQLTFDGHLLPGPDTVRQSAESHFAWNKGELLIFDHGSIIDGAARDTGNTPTFTLRPGLLLGKVTSSGKLKEWTPTATDGSQVVYGICPFPLRMVDGNFANHDVMLGVVIAGYVLPNKLYAGGGQPLNLLARSQMRGRFVFQDDLPSSFAYQPYLAEEPKTANYTIVAGDNGKLFTNAGAAGAVTFTLPALAPGYTFRFLVVADQNLTVAAAAADADKIVTFNDAAADSVSFQTAGQKIGGYLLVFSTAAADKWVAVNQSPNTLTVAT